MSSMPHPPQPEMALHLERWLGHGGRASVWLGMQAADDLWQARKASKTAINRIKPPKHEGLAA